MAGDLKFQAYRGDLGPDYVDFRGDNLKGSPVDEHRTIVETRIKDGDLPEGVTVDMILSMAKTANALFAILTSMQPTFAGALSGILGLDGEGPVKLAVRLYDED